jgi:primosomal protein N'
VARCAVALADAMRARAPEVGVLGPSPMHRLRGRTRRALLFSAPITSVITTPLRACLETLAPDLRRAAVRAAVDVDPQDA